MAAVYQALRGFKWMGKSFKQGDPITRADILRVGPQGEAKLKSLQRNRFIGLAPQDDWRTYTNTKLVEYGREVGADVHHNMRKDDLLAAIEREL